MVDFRELPAWVQATIIYSNAGKMASSYSKIYEKKMADTTDQAAKLHKIADRLHEIAKELEVLGILPDTQEKIAQDLADEADKLEEIYHQL